MRSFDRFAFQVQRVAGSPQVFAVAVAAILVWLFAGPIFHWSDSWELLVNTVTTVVSFLMSFVVQGALNRQTDEDTAQKAQTTVLLLSIETMLHGYDDRLAGLEEARHDGCH